jgi:hypothetical protein
MREFTHGDRCDGGRDGRGSQDSGGYEKADSARSRTRGHRQDR